MEIAEGRDIDVLEIDAATHTQVENVREVIIAGLPMAPVRDRYKVFIIDEFHQLSSHSFNALLKSIEEPPALIEDHVIVPVDWATRILTALKNSDGVVAGSVENGATDTLMDRAAFLCEYSHCMPPIPGGEVDWLTGNNVVYQRELLEQHREVYEAGKWENTLHDAMKAAGARLICHPDIVVNHKLHYGPFDYLGQRYLYARSYAGARVRWMPGVKKVVYGFAAFLLPPILLLRIFQRVYSKGRDRGTLFASIPLLLLFVFAWAMGEIVGYWFGPGDSLSRVR